VGIPSADLRVRAFLQEELEECSLDVHKDNREVEKRPEFLK
jgi:hypothetical protein